MTGGLAYPSALKGKLSTLHAAVITYALDHFINTAKYKMQVVSTLNTLSYLVATSSTIPNTWKPDSPLEGLELVSDDECEKTLGKLYLHPKSIIWDATEKWESTPSSSEVAPTVDVSTLSTPYASKTVAAKEVVAETAATPYVVSPTPKEHLYIKPPLIPQFDSTTPWAQKSVNGTVYTVYRSLPRVPVNQSQISATTDIAELTSADFMNLYPNCLIRTRAACMYEPLPNVTLDPIVGLILPIEGFTEFEVKDNIVKYPHIYKLLRALNDDYVSFYSHIEIDGKLCVTLNVWDSLADSKVIPKTSEFIKEYVVRRYLLERDLRHIQHAYPLYGSLDPFLTLFTTPADYIHLGYTDTLDLAKQCVASRVSYKRTRNPVMKVVCPH